MKSILISIQPQWVEKILNGEKTIEIRKTAPKCELPCKVYIYCTKSKLRTGKCVYVNEPKIRPKFGVADHWCDYKTDKIVINEGSPAHAYETYLAKGKIVAEFTLDDIDILWRNNKDKTATARVIDKNVFKKQSCMSWEQYCEYHKCKNGKYPNSYAWHITDLKVYDKPKELKFNKPYPIKCGGHEVIDCFGCPKTNCQTRIITRPPQSWCYVEDL